MEMLVKQGQLLFAVAVAALGVENLIYAHAGQPVFTGVPPAIPVLPFAPASSPLFIYLVGIALLAAGLGIAAKVRGRLPALLLGLLFLVWVLARMVPMAVARPLDLNVRTCVFEILALGASAWTLAGCLSKGRPGSPEGGSFLDKLAASLIASGPFLFAASAIVFGITHLLVIRFIASLVPAWIPGGLFWAYFTAFGFLAAGICIATGWLARSAAFWLGMMFLLWFLVLHSPRAISALRSHSPNTPAEWSSALIALGMCGGSWILAWHAIQKHA